MTAPPSPLGDIWSELSWRGLLAQSTDPRALRALLTAGPVTVYAGFDPTADSLHVGNLVPLLVLRRFLLAGHHAIAVIGGATGLVGDPGGRSSERALHATEVVAGWSERIAAQVSGLLTIPELSAGGGAGTDAAAARLRVVDNRDWLAPLSALSLLRDVGKHVNVKAMLGRDSIANRLAGEAGLSYTEFSYLVLQSLDYLELYRRYGCVLQIGGSDQWGNITAGLDLIRRVEGGNAHALTFPLLTNDAGEKFGKSTGGAVWLDPARTSPYAFYQFWLRTADADVVSRLRFFTFLSADTVTALQQDAAEHPSARTAQRRLAEEVTRLVHGENELARVQAASEALFGRGELRALDRATLGAAVAELPRTPVTAGTSVTDLLVALGLAEGRNAARRLIRDGAAYLNGTRVADPEQAPGRSDALHGRWLLLRRGRRDLAVADLAGDPDPAGQAGQPPG